MNQHWNPPPPPGGAYPQPQQGHQAPQQPQYPQQGQYPPQQGHQVHQHAQPMPGQNPHGVPQNSPPPGGQSTQEPQQPGHSVMPNAEAIAEMRARAAQVKERLANVGKGKKKFFDIPGPNGQKFSTAWVGYEGERAFYFCGAYDPHHGAFMERWSRFYKSHDHPNGKTIYAGKDSLIEKVIQNEWEANRKPEFLKRKIEFVYQGFALDYNNGHLYTNVNEHMNEQGQITPMLYAISQTLQNSLEKRIQLLGAQQLTSQNVEFDDGTAWMEGYKQIFNEDTGRPFLVTKKKTGPERMNVQYTIQDLAPMPLPDEYRPGLSNMWKLHELFPEASLEAQIAAVIECGYPLPPEYAHLAPSVSMGPPQGGYPAMQQPQYAPQQQYAPQGYQQPPQQQWAPPPGPPPQQYAPQGIPAGMPQPQSYQQQPNPPVQNPYQQPVQQQPPQQQQPRPLPAYQPGAAGAPPPAQPPPQPQYPQQPAQPPPMPQQQPQQAPQQQPAQPPPQQGPGNGDVPF